MKLDTTTQNLHGVAVCIDNYGIVITGESGIGKSDLALKLLERGHKFITDDYVKLIITNNNLNIRSHDKLSGFIHIRNIGFVDVASIYGNDSLITQHKLNLIIELTKNSPITEPLETKYHTMAINAHRNEQYQDKIYNHDTSFYYTKILGMNITMLKLNVSHNRPLDLLIELAVKCSKQLDNGYDANQNFIEQQQLVILNDIKSQ